MNYHSKTNRLTEVFICDLAADRFNGEEYLPSEQRLAEQYRASRNTIRRMLDALISDGTLLRDENRRVRINPVQAPKAPLAGSRPLTFAWAYAAYTDPMSFNITAGIQDYIAEQKLELQLITSQESHESVLCALDHAPRLGIDGVLLFSYRQECYDRTISRLLNAGTPLVVVGSPGNLPASSITADDFNGTFAAVNRLIEKHGRPVWFITHQEPANLENDDRYRGYRQAMRSSGLEEYISSHTCILLNGEAPKYWAMDQKLFRSVYQFKPHLERMEPPASVFCCDNYVANRFYLAVREAGLTVGRDLAVASFDDLPFARRLDPPLAACRVDTRLIGYRAAQLLHVAATDGLAAPVHLKVPAEFIERESI